MTAAEDLKITKLWDPSFEQEQSTKALLAWQDQSGKPVKFTLRLTVPGTEIGTIFDKAAQTIAFSAQMQTLLRQGFPVVSAIPPSVLSGPYSGAAKGLYSPGLVHLGKLTEEQIETARAQGLKLQVFIGHGP